MFFFRVWKSKYAEKLLQIFPGKVDVRVCALPHPRCPPGDSLMSIGHRVVMILTTFAMNQAVQTVVVRAATATHHNGMLEPSTAAAQTACVNTKFSRHVLHGDGNYRIQLGVAGTRMLGGRERLSCRCDH